MSCGLYKIRNESKFDDDRCWRRFGSQKFLFWLSFFSVWLLILFDAAIYIYTSWLCYWRAHVWCVPVWWRCNFFFIKKNYFPSLYTCGLLAPNFSTKKKNNKMLLIWYVWITRWRMSLKFLYFIPLHHLRAAHFPSKWPYLLTISLVMIFTLSRSLVFHIASGGQSFYLHFFWKERKQKVSISYNFETCNQRTSIHFENNKQDETLRDFGTLYISFPLPVICWVTRSCDKSVITWCWNDGTCFTAWNIWRIFRFYLLD